MAGEAVLVMTIFIIVCLAIYSPLYIIQSIGVATIAKRRGIENSWIGYVPVARQYLFGRIADDVNQKTKGKNSYWGIILLISSIFNFLLSVVIIIQFTNFFSETINTYYSTVDETLLIGMGSSFVFLSLLSYVFLALETVAFYIIIKEYKPDAAVLYTVLSIFFGLHQIFLFAHRNAVPVSLQPQFNGGYGNVYPPYGAPPYNPPPAPPYGAPYNPPPASPYGSPNNHQGTAPPPSPYGTPYSPQQPQPPSGGENPSPAPPSNDPYREG